MVSDGDVGTVEPVEVVGSVDAHFDDFPHQRTQQKHVRCLPRRGGQIIGVPAPVLSGFDAGHLRPRLPECVEGGRPCLETRTEFVTGIS